MGVGSGGVYLESVQMSTQSMELSPKCVEVPTGMLKGKRVSILTLREV
jgi:hypothetical protein